MTKLIDSSAQPTLTRRLLVPVITGFVLIVVIVALVAYRENSLLVEAEWNRKMDNVADAAVGVVEHLDRLSSVQRMVTHLAADPQVDNLFLIDFEDQRIVASSQHELLGSRLVDLPKAFLGESVLQSCREERSEQNQWKTRQGLLQRYVPVEMTYLESPNLMPHRGCLIIDLRPGDQARLTTRRTMTLALAIVGLLGLFLVVVLHSVRSRITDPMDHLARQVYAAGDERTIEVDAGLGREVHVLVQAYNASLTAIKSRQLAYQAQLQAFRFAVEGAPLADILRPITDSITKVLGSDVRAAIFAVYQERDRTNLIAGMSDDFEKATKDWPIAEDSVDSGLATYSGKPVIVPDVLDEPGWQSRLNLAARFDFRGCWSIPIFGSDGKPAASLSLYWKAPHAPDDEAMQLISFLTNTSALLLDYHRQQRIRAEAQQKTAESETRFRVLFSESPDPYLVIDIHDARILDCNPATEQTLKCPRSEIVGRTVVDFSPPAQPDGVESGMAADSMMARIVGQGRHTFEWLHRRSDGEIFTVMVNCAVNFLEGRQVVLVAWRDITERKRQADAIEQARDFYLSLLDHAPALVWRAGTDGRCNWFNQTWLHFTGRDIDQEMGDGWAEGVHPDDYERCFAIYRESLRLREPFEMEYRLRHHSGEYRWIKDVGVPIRSLSGAFDGYLGYCYDIDQRKRTESALRQFKSTLDATHDCVFMFHPDTLQFFYVNQGACEQVGFDESELLQMHPYDIKPEFPEPKFRELIARLLDGSEHSMRLETVHKHKDGHEVPVEISLQWIAPAGEQPRVVSIVTDITVRKRLQEALRNERDQLEITVRQRTADLERARDEAESATRAKSEFLANMSHEVRSPLTAVLGYADMLMVPDLPHDEGIQALQSIRRNGTHLLAILNDILDLSKIEAGKIDIEHVDCSPLQLVQEVASLLKVRAEEQDVSIRIDAGDSGSKSIRTDPTRVRQVLLNLVSNAVKFSEAGDTVEIRLEIQPKGESGKAEMTIEVKDDGIGMTPEQLKLIFQPFRQADTTTTRKYGGTGLGLAITERMVELLEGTIEVRSLLGIGSTFTVRLPVSLSASSCKTSRSEASIQPVRGEEGLSIIPWNSRPAFEIKGDILLVEDNEDIRRIITFMLNRLGAKPEFATNGLEAFEAARKKPFDLILMDMQMPVMDGYVATQALRKSGYRGKIVALTAHSMSEDREKCLNAGCDDYLTKPLNEKLLTETIARFLTVAN